MVNSEFSRILTLLRKEKGVSQKAAAMSLGVSQALLDEKGAVCAQVAEQMAQGARRALSCGLAVSATGVAGPDPDDRGNPVGLVYVSLAAPDGCWVKKLNLASPGARRDRIRTLAANHALDMVRRWLAGLDPTGADCQRGWTD